MTKTVTSGFDPVHDTQNIFRMLVHAFSRPGTHVDIQQFCSSVQPPADFPKVLMGIAFTLLDQETTFYVESEQAVQPVKDYIHWETFSEVKSREAADYHFIESMKEQEIIPYMNQLKTGTLNQPHQSATVFLLVDGLEENERAIAYNLTGPGIQSECTLAIEGLDPKWMESREELTNEYPLGIDLCFITRDGKMAAVPRTTKLERR